MISYHAVSISHTLTGNCYESTYYGYYEDNIGLEMDDIIDIGMEVEVNEDFTYELEDPFDHQSEGAIISKTTKIEI